MYITQLLAGLAQTGVAFVMNRRSLILCRLIIPALSIKVVTVAILLVLYKAKVTVLIGKVPRFINVSGSVIES